MQATASNPAKQFVFLGLWYRRKHQISPCNKALYFEVSNELADAGIGAIIGFGEVKTPRLCETKDI
jgi:hypothetical protein